MLELLPVILGGILATIASQVLDGRELEPGEPPVAIGAALALAALSYALAYATARVGVGAIVRTRGAKGTFRRYALAGKALWLLLLGLYGLALDAGGLVALAHDRGPELAAAIVGGPWLLACFATWTGAFLGERRALEGSHRLRDELRSKARRVLAPVLAFGAVAIVVTRIGSLELVREAFDLHPHARPLVVGVGVLALFAAGPLVVMTLAPTSALGDLRATLPTWLEEAAGKLSFRDWDLGSPVATASVTGLVRGGRTVFVTRALLGVLDESELAAVVGHEVGHAALGHLAVRASIAVALVLLLDDAVGGLEHRFPENPAASLAVLAVALALVSVGFIALARRLEHDADLYAAEHAGSDVVSRALEKAAQANGLAPERGGWLHPSPRARIELLGRASVEPELWARRLARSRWIVRVVVAATVLAAGVDSVELAVESFRPIRERLLRAATDRLAGGETELARAYVERALAQGEDARALLLRARTRPSSERDKALDDLARAKVLAGSEEELATLIERARTELIAAR